MVSTTGTPDASGRRRSRRTRYAVRAADRVAGVLIRFGGLGTILAVSLVCVFLVWVVVPLFLPGSLREHRATSVPWSTGTDIVHVASDEYLMICYAVFRDGTVIAWRPETGELLSEERLFEDNAPVAWSFGTEENRVAAAFSDGTVSIGRIGFVTEFLDEDHLPEALQSLSVGSMRVHEGAVVQRTPEGQWRSQRLHVEMNDPIQVKTESSPTLIDLSVSSRGTVFALLTDDGRLRVEQVRERKNLLTGKITLRLEEGVMDVSFPGAQSPMSLLLSGLGDAVYLVWPDGTLQRYDTRDVKHPTLVETVDLVAEPDARVTALEPLIGKTSLLVGDSSGNIAVWFRIKPADAETADGALLVAGRHLPGSGARVVDLGASARSRMFSAMYADGKVRLFFATSERLIDEVALPSASEGSATIAMAPKDDAVLALTSGRYHQWQVAAPHPEITWHAIVGPVWYEGYEKPEHVWQSSSGTDQFEAKYGLIPLVFGTLKATFYSMLFGAPLALLAAIYTSEFLHPRVKAKIKPTIEIMASLPSVVLGFLAALFFAPLVENIVPECLTALAIVPFTYLAGAYLWQLFPGRWGPLAARYRMVAMMAALPLGLWLAWQLGGLVEHWLFAGDMAAWLDGQRGTGTGAWMFLLLPASAVFVAWVTSSFVTPWMHQSIGHWSRERFAWADLAKFAAASCATLAVAYTASQLLAAVGWDPRGTFVDTYVQRNALVVGGIMGFAVIPIIYTISDDALSAVPESLRAGSLGAGATQWQTAVRIVIPTAMSGLFSAMMIGLGRAVGETMIVLMAAGNTPVMDWNIFNGFRTLSANIAVELPEAVIDSTHYRMLFLAALTLFLMTFVVNTVAEVVRLQFRKRAFQL